jgi:hypothetical protein
MVILSGGLDSTTLLRCKFLANSIADCRFLTFIKIAAQVRHEYRIPHLVEPETDPGSQCRDDHTLRPRVYRVGILDIVFSLAATISGFQPPKVRTGEVAAQALALALAGARAFLQTSSMPAG